MLKYFLYLNYVLSSTNPHLCTMTYTVQVSKEACIAEKTKAELDFSGPRVTTPPGTVALFTACLQTTGDTAVTTLEDVAQVAKTPEDVWA